jgi:triphosphoribosyl-dephospho-CoA synthase
MLPQDDNATTFVEAALRAACLLEATARKPGNVHPEASFADLEYRHFQDTAEIIVQLPHLVREGVGRAIFEIIERGAQVAPSNANLGIVLLLAPLAAVPSRQSLAEGIPCVLDNLTVEDAEFVYRAIRLARPGGLGKVGREDVANRPTESLRAVMELASQRDRIARQYASGFADVLHFGMPRLALWSDFSDDWETAVIQLHLELLAEFPDSLIVRKCGIELATEASRRARRILDAGWPRNASAATLLHDFDHWLRADGNRRNPGTTADLVAACLFAAMRERLIPIPDWAKLPRRSVPAGALSPTTFPN